MRSFARIALRIDELLRRFNKVYEYSDDPRCVFRMQVSKACRDMVLAGGVMVSRGDMVVDVHLWNENIPEIPPEGPTIAWARRMGSAMDFSLRQLSTFMAGKGEFSPVVAIRANTAVSTARTKTQLIRLMQHFGFEIVHHDSEIPRLRRLHERAENLLGLLLVMAVNPASARISVLSRVRSEMFLSRQSFDRRYGVPSPGIRATTTNNPAPSGSAPPVRQAPTPVQVSSVPHI